MQEVNMIFFNNTLPSIHSNAPLSIHKDYMDYTHPSPNVSFIHKDILWKKRISLTLLSMISLRNEALKNEDDPSFKK